MAYEVVKTIGGREYRYRVQSERDPASGKTRNRWTYLGRAGGAGEVRARPPRRDTRLRLLAAAEQLLEAGDAAAVTADAIAASAGVAHGTFYRYFRDRSDALEALARHLRETGVAGDDRLLSDAVETRQAARSGVRMWSLAKLRGAHERRASIRAWYALIASDARLAAYREERRESTQCRLRKHLEALTARGFARIDDPAATAAMLMAFVEGIMRTTILEDKALDEARIAAAAEVFDRAIFARMTEIEPA